MSDNKKDDMKVAMEVFFERSTTDISILTKVGDHIRTGKRWDMTHKNIIGEVIVIHNFKTITTRFGEAGLCKIDHQGEVKMCLMGGSVLLDQLIELEKMLPVLAIVRKPAKAYTFVDPTQSELDLYKKTYLS